MVDFLQSALDCIASWPWSAAGEALTSYVYPLAAPIAAFFVANKFGNIQAAIGRRQAETAALAMNTARNKLRLDLFDKRFAVYEATNSFINGARGLKGITDMDSYELVRSTKSAIWLFDEKTANFITKKIYHDALAHENVFENLALDPDPSEKSELIAKRKELRERFIEHQAMLHDLMTPYLRFTEETP